MYERTSVGSSLSLAQIFRFGSACHKFENKALQTVEPDRAKMLIFWKDFYNINYLINILQIKAIKNIVVQVQ